MVILFFLCIAFVVLAIVALCRNANKYDWINNPQREPHLRWCGKASTSIAG